MLKDLEEDEYDQKQKEKEYIDFLQKQDPTNAWLVELNRRLLQITFKEFIPATRDPFPDYVSYYVERMAEMVSKKAPIAMQLHKNKTVGPFRDDKNKELNQNLAGLFYEPEYLLRYLASSDLVDLEHPNRQQILRPVKV